jgi:hypothetical protein
LVLRDSNNVLRFNADIINARQLCDRLEELADDYGDAIAGAERPIAELYEEVFNHKAFTGRSGTMFGFEGLGSIYWHMVSKLLLAVEELYFAARANSTDADTCNALGQLYYRIRDGIGFNKTPTEYGAFPTDPYSHTPRHAGARQPGMTGQVKEEVLSRFGELGVRINDGVVRFDPCLLRRQEFVDDVGTFEYLDVDGDWQELAVPAASLAFTWCQVPIVYRLDDADESGIVIHREDGSTESTETLELTCDDSEALFRRSGDIRQLTVSINPNSLLVL